MYIHVGIVVFLCFLFLYFSSGRRQGFQPYIDNWNWDVKGFPGQGDPYKVQTAGMDILTPLPFYVKYNYPAYWQTVSSPGWFYDTASVGPIAKPWGPGSRDMLVRF